MEIPVDRYLDDGPMLLVTLAVRSRTTAAHSVLSALDSNQKAAVQAVLVRAMDDISDVLRPVAAAMPENKG